MRVIGLTARNFRCYETAEATLGSALTVVFGHNGAGKTNLLEALYFACTGRSCRTSNEREVVRFGSSFTRLHLTCGDSAQQHEISVGFEPGQPKRLQVDGSPVERLVEVETRPLVSVFLPDRLELIAGPPALRRGHLDQVAAALWPARRATRTSYTSALAQRNALLSSIRSGRAGRGSLPAWDAELARHGIALMADRQELVDRLGPVFEELANTLGLQGGAQLRYRPRSKATTVQGLTDELSARVTEDLERGFSSHGPHRDDLVFQRSDRDLRAYGSRGQQRLALLALLLAEREEIRKTRGTAPLMLLDDVMSELDADRRIALCELLLAGGQSVVTTTDLAHVPASDREDVVRMEIQDCAIHHAFAAGREHEATA